MPSTLLLRQYIKMMLTENVDSNNPINDTNIIDAIETAWQNPQEFVNEKNPFIAMQIVTKQMRLKPISSGEIGSSRIVFLIDDDKVLKLARNEKGIAQNELEAVAGQDPTVDKILARVLEYSEEYAWLISQRVNPISSEKEFEAMAGITWNELRKTLGAKEREELNVTAVPEKSPKKQTPTPISSSCLTGPAFVNYIKSFLERYSGMLVGDIAKPDSWGSTKDGCLVLLDYGITKKKFDQLYK